MVYCEPLFKSRALTFAFRELQALALRTKPEIALAEIDRAIVAGVRFGCVLADAGYGLSAPFRQGLTARKLTWAVGIPRHLRYILPMCR